jgi:hypothetical protein
VFSISSFNEDGTTTLDASYRQDADLFEERAGGSAQSFAVK